jgi:hypothetical protein
VQRPAWLAPSRRTTVLRALALVGGHRVGLRWRTRLCPRPLAGVQVAVGHRRGPAARTTSSAGFRAPNGNGRYQYWQAALHAEQTDALKGIGPGTFEFWWARHGTGGGFVRDAHTLYFQTLAETGIVGFVLLIGMLAFLLGAAVVRSLRAPPGTRLWIAAAVGGLATFMTSAAFEWVWQMGAIACAVMALGAMILAGRDEADVPASGSVPAPASPERPARTRRSMASRVPMPGALATRDSQDAAAQGRLTAALQDSRTAQRVQPYAATPHLQQALVLEQAGSLPRRGYRGARGHKGRADQLAHVASTCPS